MADSEPRVGLAWHPMDKLVVRSGFALMHVDLGLAPSQLDEYSISTTQSQASGNPTPLYQISQGPNADRLPGLTSLGRSPTQAAPRHAAELHIPTCAAATPPSPNPNLQNPYAMTWNLDVQYQLRQTYLLELTYDGTRRHRQSRDSAT